MENILSTHFKAIDNAKNLLFNSTNKNQVEQMYNFLNALHNQENNLYIN